MPRFMVRRGCSPEQHYWIGSPEQLPAGGGLPVDRTCLLEGGLYVAQLLPPGSSCARGLANLPLCQYRHTRYFAKSRFCERVCA